MARLRVLQSLICLSLLAFGLVRPARAQDLPPEPPVVDILGRPDTRSRPPEAQIFVSVVDRPTGRSVTDLQASNFAVEVSQVAEEPTVTLDTRGLAIVAVVDRGGIAQRGDPRIREAADLVDAMLDMLSLDGSETTDMMALIGIRGAEQGGLTPTVNFTDFDPNAIRNQLDGLRTEVVDETTPLYDGIDLALAWIGDNPDPGIRQKLENRRRVIVVFSDGIDRNFSDESHEALIVSQAQERDVLIYAVEMSAAGRAGEAASLRAMAVQSGGAFLSHSAETHEDVLARLQGITSQRDAYHVTFPLIRPPGDYQLRIQVSDGSGATTADTAIVTSHLQRPVMTLSAASDPLISVPYSTTIEGYHATRIPLSVRIAFEDGALREFAEVSYFANEQRVGIGEATGSYDFVWDVTDREAPADDPITRTFTLIARARDPYLQDVIESQPVDLTIVWGAREALPTKMPEEVTARVAENWWVLPLFAIVALGLLVVTAVLIRTRGQLARRVAQSTTDVVRGVTRRLGSEGVAVVRGKLVAIQGPRAGNEFRLVADVTKVGRDDQPNDIALGDRYVSNPHFSIVVEGDRFYIRDEGSTNGTRMNGAVVPPNQRMPLPPNAIIEVGQTRLQLKRLGGATRVLAPPGSGSSLGQTQVARGSKPTQASPHRR